MEWYTTLILGMAILFVLFLSGAPIFLAFLAAILLGVYFVIGPAGFSDVRKLGARYGHNNFTGVDTPVHFDGRAFVPIRHNGCLI